MRAFFSVVAQIGNLFDSNLSHKILVEKSTVPLGTGQQMRAEIQRRMGDEFAFDDHYTVVNMPEFLAEGSAINDLVNPQRVVIGTANNDAFTLLNHLI